MLIIIKLKKLTSKNTKLIIESIETKPNQKTLMILNILIDHRLVIH